MLTFHVKFLLLMVTTYPPDFVTFFFGTIFLVGHRPEAVYYTLVRPLSVSSSAGSAPLG